MSKQLSEMTLEELWELFPIVLVPHSAERQTWYDIEACALKSLLGGKIAVISHIGSTAQKKRRGRLHFSLQPQSGGSGEILR